MSNKEMNLDDLNDITVDIFDVIEKGFAKFDIKISDPDLDSICDSVEDILKIYTNGEYSNYN